MNLSRVIGPAIGALLISLFGISSVFSINAATYGFAVAEFLAHYDARNPNPVQGKPLEKVLSGADLVERPAPPAHLHHDVLVLVRVADVRRALPRGRQGELGIANPTGAHRATTALE